MKFYPMSRYRNILSQDYIEEEVRNGAVGYGTFEEADKALDMMDTDDSDFEVCVYDGLEWRATRDGVTFVNRLIPE